MTLEQKLSKIEKQFFTADGNESGVVSIKEHCLFRVKQKVIIDADGLPSLNAEIKRITNNTIIVGPINTQGNLSTPYPTIDLSTYIVALNASIRAPEQLNPYVPVQEIERFVYEEEPVVANRQILVDKCGDFYDNGNPLPVTNNPSPNSPTITNIHIPSANTEHSFILPKDATRFLFKVRDGKSKAKISYQQNASNIEYMTISMGSSFIESGIDASDGITLYFQTVKPNMYVEILVWSTI